MRAYSQSQGRFIDVPETGAMPTSQQAGPPTLGQQGGDANDQLKKLLGIGALSKGQYSTAAGLLVPEKSADEKKRAVKIKQLAPPLVEIANLAIEAPTGFAGWWGATTGKIPGVAGGKAESLERKTAGYARLVANALATEVGTATDLDVKRWRGLMPKPGDTKEERLEHSLSLLNEIISEAQGLDIELPTQVYEAREAILNAQTGQVGQKDIQRFMELQKLYDQL